MTSRSIAIGALWTWTGIAIGAIALSLFDLAGWRPLHLGLVSDLLLITAAVATLSSMFVDRQQIQTSQRLRTQDVIWDIQLTTPARIALGQYAFISSFGLIVATPLSAMGWTKAAVGLALSWLAFSWLAIFGSSQRVDYLVFKRDRLQVQINNVRFEIKWSNVHALDSVGPNHHLHLLMRLTNVADVIRTVEPSSEGFRIRRRLGKDGTLVLPPWSGGLDGDALKRFVAAASDRRAI